MTDFTLEIATNEHGLAKCGCGENDLHWRAAEDHLAHEADHTLEEAREIGGVLPWDNHDPNDEDIQRLLDDDSNDYDTYEDFADEKKARAERNGLAAYCGKCYSSMSPSMKTEELRDDIQRER